ncbi:hypothetical protein GCM10010207_53070 [Streptomyces atratus]|nr:hypothetical protein GCM10010207_53070 [Streptomyces atratus]
MGKQLMGSEMLRSDWFPALSDGLRHAGQHAVPRSDFTMAFYGDLFRPPGRTLAVGDPMFTASDVTDGFELDLLLAWWQHAADIDPAVPPATGSTTLARSPRAAQTALRALQRSRFFADVSLRALVFDLKQVRRYLLDPDLRTAARRRVQERIGPGTRVVVGHSLGSVVAYEALCAMPGHPVKALVTLGSPLGMRMVFDRLLPRPGDWPGSSRPCPGDWPSSPGPSDRAARLSTTPPVGSKVVCAGDGSRPYAVTSDRDNTVRVWDLSTGRPIGEPFTFQGGPVKAAACSELDGRPVVVTLTPGALQVVDLTTGRRVGPPLTRRCAAWLRSRRQPGGALGVVASTSPVGPAPLTEEMQLPLRLAPADEVVQRRDNPGQSVGICSEPRDPASAQRRRGTRLFSCRRGRRGWPTPCRRRTS